MKTQAAAVRSFIADLNRLREEAGSPSLGRLAELSNRKLLKTTLDDHLSGRRSRLPTWELVAAYVSACRRAAELTGLNAARLGSLDDWNIRHRAALAGDSAARWPIQELRSGELKPIVDIDELTLGGKTSRLRTCSGCAEPNSETSRYCSQCGTPLLRTIDRADHTDGIYFGPDEVEVDSTVLAQAVGSHQPILFAKRGPERGMSFTIEGGAVSLGRGPNNDVVLNHTSVSRRHAVIYKRDGEFRVRDVGSLNGVYINADRIDDAPISAGDAIVIGVYRLEFIYIE